jgi:subtilisin family serine protease/subtilisin-like proprotein convertase family protein
LLEQLEDRSMLDAGTAAMIPQFLVTLKSGQVQTVPLDDGANFVDAFADLQAREDVATVEMDQHLSVTLIPDDTRFGELWGMRNTANEAEIDADLAWDLHTGTTKTIVGIIDTGIDYRHPDLYKNIWINQGEIPASRLANLTDIDPDGAGPALPDGLITFYDLNDPINIGAGKITDQNGNGRIDGGDLLAPMNGALGGWADGLNPDDTRGWTDDLVGWDFINNDNNPLDDNNHGTHVAGTIGAMGNNNLGVVGVNWVVQMAGLKFLGANGSGLLSGAVNAVDYARLKGIKITNNSWGGGGFSTSLSNAIANAGAEGGIFVAAAGNSASNNDQAPAYPASYTHANIISVASITSSDALSSFSNYGRTSVDLGAPGSGILSTVVGTGYASFNGTSMATPHVAGAVALVWSQNPSLTHTQVINRILSNVEPTAALNGRTVTGGRLNAFKALEQAPADTSGAKINSAVANGTLSATSIRVTFDEAVQPGSFSGVDVTLSRPNGSLVSITSVSAVDTTNTKFDINFASVTDVGTYSFSIGPDILDVAGNRMNQDGDGTNGETPDDRYTGTFDITAPPADLTGARVTSAIANGTTTIDSLTVTFNEAIDSTSFSGIDVSLVDPANTPILITNVQPADSTNTKFTVSFAVQSVGGVYQFSIGPDILDLAGNPMDQNQNNTNGENPGDIYTSSFEIVPPPADVTGGRVTSANSNATAAGADSIRVTFNEAINAGSFSVDDVSIFDPSGSPVSIIDVQPVAGSDTQFDITFDRVTTVGSYQFFIGPDVLDLAGNPMDQNQNGTNGENPADVYSGTFAINGSRRIDFTSTRVTLIRDLVQTNVTMFISQNVPIIDLDVQLNISHTAVGQLNIFLRTPSGQQVSLFNRRGGTGNDLTDTRLDDEASSPVSGGTAPFTGSFRPESTLSVVDGRGSRGFWTLVIVDSARGDVGQLNSWTLSFEEPTSPAGIRSNGDESDGNVAAPLETSLPVSGTSLFSLPPVGTPSQFLPADSLSSLATWLVEEQTQAITDESNAPAQDEQTTTSSLEASALPRSEEASALPSSSSEDSEDTSDPFSLNGEEKPAEDTTF